MKIAIEAPENLSEYDLENMFETESLEELL